MHNLNGIQVASHLQRSGSDVKVVFLTVHEDHDYVEAAFSIGVLGYVLKPRFTNDLIPAIEEALQGRRFVSKFPARQV
jgi:DNA-binding NarL/FixJ family response regulator